MLAVDQLLVLLLEGKSRVSHHMKDEGYTEAEIREAWKKARAEGWTESTGLGQDRLTDAGRARGQNSL
jgi:hypothetical protein